MLHVADESFRQALSALNAGDAAGAEHEFRHTLELQSHHLGALNLLAVMLMKMERFAEAEEFIARAVKLDQDSEVSFYNYGLILKQLNRPKEALAQFDHALHLNAQVPETWNNRGTVLNDLQDYERALADFDRAIQLNPNYVDALHNKGNALSKLGRYDEALMAYDRALALKPGLAEAWLGRGNALVGLKRYEEAFAAYDRALALNPNLAGAWLGRADALVESKRYDEALAAYDKALALKPDLAEAWVARGNLAWKLRRYHEASRACDQALSLNPNLAEAWLIQGNVLTDLKRYDEASAAYDKALLLEPDLAEAWLGCGSVFSTLYRCDQALAAYDKALLLKPDLAEAWVGRGNAFADLHRYDEALAAYDKAVSLKPDLAEAWVGRGNVFGDLKRYDEAFAAFDKALDIEPDLAEAWLGRGNVFTELKRYDDAVVAYDTGIALDPDLAELYWNKALAKLTVGDFMSGWNLYEWRFHIRENYNYYSKAIRSMNLKYRQDERAFVDKNVIVLAEQGIGDEIMFTSILPDLLQNARTVTYECDKRLVPLFSRSFPNVAFIERDDTRQSMPTQADIVVKQGSLAFSYRSKPSSFPARTYLAPDQTRVSYWAGKLKRHAGSRIKIGISWRGGLKKTRANDRSIELGRLTSLIAVPGTFFVDLQYGNHQEEIHSFNKDNTGTPVHRLLDDVTNDFDELAALISALDLVISVQNSTIHLCGALGKTCWGLTPFRPEWRYGSAREDMIWYPSIKLYRQAGTGDWDSVLRPARAELELMSRGCIDV